MREEVGKRIRNVRKREKTNKIGRRTCEEKKRKEKKDVEKERKKKEDRHRRKRVR